MTVTMRTLEIMQRVKERRLIISRCRNRNEWLRERIKLNDIVVEKVAKIKWSWAIQRVGGQTEYYIGSTEKEKGS